MKKGEEICSAPNDTAAIPRLDGVVEKLIQFTLCIAYCDPNVAAEARDVTREEEELLTC